MWLIYKAISLSLCKATKVTQTSDNLYQGFQGTAICRFTSVHSNVFKNLFEVFDRPVEQFEYLFAN